MATQAIQSRYAILGMDCSSCAAKIERAARRVEGIEDVSVSVAGGTMTLRHSADANLAKLEERICALGYGATALTGEAAVEISAQLESCDHVHHHAAPGHEKLASCRPVPVCADAGRGASADRHDPGHLTGTRVHGPRARDHAHRRDPAGTPWYATVKARLTGASGLALAAAYALGHALPAYASWFFAAAMLVGLVPIARRAFLGAWLAGEPFSIETLMTIAAAGAFIIGATREAAVVVFLFLVGELLEGLAAGRARASISALGDLVPKMALIERDGRIVSAAADDVIVGDVVLVRPGDRAPADGVILTGESALDEAPVTGESAPVAKGPGDSVFAGTVNGAAALRIRVTAAAMDNTIARVIKLVEEAQESKAPTERFIDRFSRAYTPAVVAIAGIVAVGPPLLAGAAWSSWIYKGLAILLIGCPCALVISTPAAIAASLASGARRGLLIKGGGALETLGRVTAVAFDKTGTLTEGRPQVTDVIGFGIDEAGALRLAAALEAGSSHPLAIAILACAAERSIVPPRIEHMKNHAGKGVSAFVEGRELFLGSVSAAREREAIDQAVESRLRALRAEGKSVAVLVADGQVIGAFAMRDEPRADASSGLRRLAQTGIATLMLTGDNRQTAEAMGRRLGVAVRAELLPEDKQRIVAELQAQGRRVAKVGDGVNDAPALATADVGIAMGGGTDVALETGDAASLHGRVGDVADMIALSKRTMANIRQNIGMALGLKAVFLVTTIVGVTGLWPAILADTGATVLVTANALRLLGGSSRASMG